MGITMKTIVKITTKIVKITTKTIVKITTKTIVKITTKIVKTTMKIAKITTRIMKIVKITMKIVKKIKQQNFLSNTIKRKIRIFSRLVSGYKNKGRRNKKRCVKRLVVNVLLLVKNVEHINRYTCN